MIIIFDTETTGIPKHPEAKMALQPRCIEVAAVGISLTGEVLDEIVMQFNPQQPLEPIITKITGLTDEALADKPLFEDCLSEVRSFFEGGAAVIAHNLPFDTTIVDLEFQRAGVEPLRWPRIQICTVQENAERWGRRPKLTELYAELIGETLHQTHRALDDVEALVKVCQAMGVFDDIAAAA